MRPGKFFRLAAVLLWVLALSFASCTSEVGDIDRTEPDKMKKADLKGVWYYAATVIEAPVPSPVTFDGEMAYFPGPTKVRFDIQEEFLVVYPATELYVEGSEEKWKKKKLRNFWDEGKQDEFVELYVGEPVAVYEITSHFDVIRQYNAQTGEQSNIIIEDEDDRHWYEREYIRVNWADNKLTDLMFMAAAKGSSVDYYVQEYEQDNPDAFEMTENSINFVAKMFLEPDSPDSCSVYTIAPTDCAGIVAKVRHSFIKVDPNNDYVGLFYGQQKWMDKFGFFLTERQGYDENYGLTFPAKVYLIQRWNMWTNSRTNVPILDEDSNQVRCHEDVECEGLHDGLTHCWLEDGWHSEGHCVTWDPTPLHERGVQPIRYWISSNWPAEVKTSCYETADQWNEPFMDTVAWVRFYSEKGLYDVKYCESDADCAPAEQLLDTEYLNTHPRYCNPQTEAEDELCKVGMKHLAEYSQCTGGGECVTPLLCDAKSPCAYGQACMSGVCHQCTKEDGNCSFESAGDWEKIAGKVVDRGAFTTYYINTAEGTEFKRGVDDAFEGLSSRDVRIAFAHLNPNVGPVKLLNAEGKSVCLNADGSDMVFKYQPGAIFKTPGCNIMLPDEKNEDTGMYMFNELTVNLTAVDVETKAPVGVYSFTKMTGQTVHTFALVGDANKSILIHGEDTQNEVSLGGIRLAHGALGRGAVDFSVQGSLVSRNNSIGTFSRYGGVSVGNGNMLYSIGAQWGVREDGGDLLASSDISGSLNRAVVIPAGSTGEITCFKYHDVGTCTGWRAELTDADYARVAEIRAGLQDMYIICDNVYTGDLCDPDEFTTERADRLQHQNDCRYWQQDEAGEWFNPCKDVEGAADLKKHGDLRYSLYYWIPEDQSSSPLGYGPNAADPDTGEVYYGIANIYGGPMISYGQYAKDLLDAARGELSKENIMTSDYIREYIESKGNPSTYESLYAPLPDKQRHERLKQLRPPVKPVWLDAEQEQRIMALRADPDKARSLVDPRLVRDRMMGSLPESMSKDQLSARFGKVAGSWLEDLMINEEVKHVMSGGSLIDNFDGPGDKAALTPMNWASPAAIEKDRARLEMLASHNYYAQEVAEPNVYATAVAVHEYCKDEANQAKYGGDADSCEVWEITKRMLDGVLEHEVGHTVGLRHVFSASADAFNFQDEYYEKRTTDYRTCYLQGPNGCLYGDTCKILCDDSKDCMPGTTCEDVEYTNGDVRKTCVDDHLDPLGWCWGDRKQVIDCQSDGDCASLGDAICRMSAEESFGHCAVAATPNEMGLCPEGALLVNGNCVKDDYCSKDKGVCTIDASRSCAGDEDCSKIYQVVAENVFGPIVGFESRSYQTQEEIDAGRTEYQYSSLMDYGGTVTFDLHGLGKYDKAAIRFGYGELIDVYVDVDRLYEEMEDVGEFWNNDKYGWSSLFMNTSIFNDFYWYHPFFFLNDFIGVKENLERVPVPYRKADMENIMVSSEDRGRYDLSYRMVPWLTGYDMWRGNLETYVFDLGIDMGEIIDHSWSKLIEYYVFDAFKRERWGAFRGANPSGYFQRILGRWFPPIADVGRYHAMFYTGWRAYAEEGNDEDFLDILYSNSNWMKRWELYSDDALQKLAILLFTPTPGAYKRVDKGTDKERYVNYSYTLGQADSELDVPVGKGKFPYTTFYGEAGYHYYDHPAFIGSFWEKLAAAHTMTYSVGYFLSSYISEQTTDLMIGSSIGFNSVYYTELTNMLSGFIVGERDRYAPYVENGQMFPFDPLHPWEGTGMIRMETSIESLSMKAYMGLYGFSYVPSGFDPGFLDSFRLCLKGNGNCYTPSTEEDWEGDDTFVVDEVEYTDPWSKKTYLARTTNYDPDRVDAAVEMLVKANEVKEELEMYEWGESEETDLIMEELTQELAEIGETLDLVLTYNLIYGNLGL